MLKVLLAVDGSTHAEHAARQVPRLREAGCALDVHVLNVRIPIESGHVRLFIRPDDIEAYYREEGYADLASARAILDAAGIAYTSHIAVGHIADTIARYANEYGFDLLVMGTHGRSALTHVLLGSVATNVIHQTSVPVMLIK